jgi:hypothetical protein
MKFLRHAQTVFWVAMALYGLITLYGKVRTEMTRQIPCQPVTGEVR